MVVDSVVLCAALVLVGWLTRQRSAVAGILAACLMANVPSTLEMILRMALALFIDLDVGAVTLAGIFPDTGLFAGIGEQIFVSSIWGAVLLGFGLSEYWQRDSRVLVPVAVAATIALAMVPHEFLHF